MSDYIAAFFISLFIHAISANPTRSKSIRAARQRPALAHCA
ncbi:hypothetical protein [Bradyrhizobium sp. CCBAU 51753]|nr:hypothetical protein [Bradyrhizobium sp. CCBAU 51753]